MRVVISCQCLDSEEMGWFLPFIFIPIIYISVSVCLNPDIHILRAISLQVGLALKMPIVALMYSTDMFVSTHFSSS